MDMLNRGHARADHLEGRVQRVEVEVEAARHHPGDEPKLERHIGRAELDRCQADVVVGVDEGRQHDLGAAADHRRVGIALAEVVVGADGGNQAVVLKHCAVFDFLPAVSVEGPGYHPPAADQRRAHASAFWIALEQLRQALPARRTRDRLRKEMIPTWFHPWHEKRATAARRRR